MRYACDHCNKVIDVDAHKQDWEENWKHFEYDGLSYHLCPECSDKLIGYLDGTADSLEHQEEGKTEMPEVGEKISFNLTDGTPAQALAVMRRGNAMLFCMYDCIAVHRMNENTTEGGWAATEMCRWMNEELIRKFPRDLVDRMRDVDGFGHKLRLPKEKEIFGENGYGKDEEGVLQWEPMKDIHNRVAKDCDEDYTRWYWLMTVYSASRFCLAYAHGAATNTDASFVGGVRPVFSLIY